MPLPRRAMRTATEHKAHHNKGLLRFLYFTMVRWPARRVGFSMRKTLCWIHICVLLTALCVGSRVNATEPHPVSAAKTLMSAEIFGVPDGAPVSLARLGLGRQPILFILWATWCKPCIQEMPLLAELHRRYGKAIRFVGIAQDLNSAANRRVVKEVTVQLTYRQFVEKDGPTMIGRIFGPQQTALPAFALYGAKSGGAHGQVGSLEDADNLSTLTNELLKQTSLVSNGASR
jgi:thiol-disulfide isomerase/thioredoxin